MSINMNITERFQLSRDRDRSQYLKKEKVKFGNLRAGSTGIMSEAGDVAGNCHRKSHLRSLGIEIDEPKVPQLIMFELGYANEDRIVQVLQQTLAENEILLREEEIPIEWLTSNGTKVSGRPDIVICAHDIHSDTMQIPEGNRPIDGGTLSSHRPVLGLELKSVHSVWVAKEVLFNKSPKMGHLVQAAHYMWKLDIPYKLVYRSYSQLGQGMAGSDGWMSRMFPKQGADMSEYVEFNEEKGTIKHIRQFEIVYDLMFDSHGRLHYKPEMGNDWTASIITKQDIERYFEYVSRMAQDKQLGQRPLTIGPDGSKLSYSDCNYCPLQATCDSHEDKGYDKWLTQVRKLSLVK